jgi:hypothetical protein
MCPMKQGNKVFAHGPFHLIHLTSSLLKLHAKTYTLYSIVT